METPTVDPDAFNAFEAAGWAERADGYHRFFGSLTTQVIEPLLDAAAVGAGKRVLDVATGPGYCAAAATARGADTVGVDVAGEMLTLARRLHPGIEFVQGDAEHLPFDDGSFDAVVGNFVILHLGRPEQGAAELVRVLEPGGRLALSTWDLPERTRLLGVFLEAAEEVGAAPPDIPAGPPFFRFAEDSEFTRLLEGAGLADVEVQTLSLTHRLPSADELWDGFRDGTVRIGALLVGQAPETTERLRAAFDRRVRDYTAADGSIELPVSVKVASGRLAPD
jgi:SAM-dependent methyltransferase